MILRRELEASVLTDLLFQEPGVGRCLVAPDGSVLRANAEWLRATGFTLEEVLGADLVELFPETRDMALALHARARAGHRVEVPPHAQPQHGREAWWEGSIAPVPMDGGTGLLVTAREVRREAASPDLAEIDAALRASEERFRLLTEAMPQIVCLLQPDGTPEYVNTTWIAFSGLRLDETSRARWDGVLHPDDVGAARECRRRVVELLEPQDVELRYRAADGTYRWFLNRLAPVVKHGRVVRLIGAAMDIEGRKRAEAALRESEVRYRTMGETLPYGIWRCNPEGGEEYVSQSFLHLLEMTQEEMRDFGWTHRLPPEDVEPMMERWMKCLRTGTPWDSELRVLGPDGKYHHVLTRGLPVRDEAGKITSWVGINLDIDDRKAMEEELRDADRRKTEFLGVLSHELRNPLAPIRNSIYLLEHAAPGSERAARAKAVIRRQTEHLTRLVDDLLDVTRIARGKIPLQRTRVDLREIVRKTTDDLGSVFGTAGIQLRVGHVLGPVWIEADPTRVAQVLGNLLLNSVKFTPTGGTVTVALAVKGPDAELSIRDNGVGMEPATVEHMFEPFAQADQTLARTEGGLGLGLALVKGLVELHGGSVRARSEGLGRGAEFLVRLPLAGDGDAVEAERRAAAGASSRAILVVEDNADAAQSLADVLALHGHRVRVARDGRSGVELARELRPDVVLCDIGLPDVDGYEVARAIRRDRSLGATRLVALSGYAQPEDRQRGREAGFDAHVAKPPDLDELLSVIAKDG